MSEELGPLSGLEGVWEGDKGTDRSPDDDRVSVEVNAFRERMTFDATGLVENHEQRLYGLRYTTTAWRVGAAEAFHEDMGYWLWDASSRQLMKCFVVPRGVTVVAGGTADASATSFSLAAELGSPTYGICSNPFLDAEFRTVRFELSFEKRDADTIYYKQDTVMEVAGVDGLFHHTDENTLTRVR